MPETTSLEYVYYALHLYASCLSLRKTAKHLSIVTNQKESCFNMELDSKVQGKEHILKEKQSLGIHNR